MIIHFSNSFREACHIRSRWEYPVKELVHQFRSLWPVPIYYPTFFRPLHPSRFGMCCRSPAAQTHTYVGPPHGIEVRPESRFCQRMLQRVQVPSVSIFSRFPDLRPAEVCFSFRGSLKSASFPTCPPKKPRSVAGIRAPAACHI